jgi:uncharacterized protein (TIGR03084 family)
MAVDLPSLLADLSAETGVVDGLLSALDVADWERSTPAEGWAIRDQVSHLAFFDDVAVLAAEDPKAFETSKREVLDLGDDFVDQIAERYRAISAGELLGWFRSSRRRLVDVFGSIDPSVKLPWFGPPMSAASSVTARLMETWAHGRDIADTLGNQPEATDRLRQIAHIGVRTLGFSFQLHGRDVPAGPVYVELSAPSGDTWSWGPPDAPNAVRGTAEDFCLVVTQRRNTADTRLHATGVVAREWMEVAQAFAGPPGTGRPAREDARPGVVHR